jgi:hypothetical protein
MPELVLRTVPPLIVTVPVLALHTALPELVLAIFAVLFMETVPETVTVPCVFVVFAEVILPERVITPPHAPLNSADAVPMFNVESFSPNCMATDDPLAWVCIASILF